MHVQGLSPPLNTQDDSWLLSMALPNWFNYQFLLYPLSCSLIQTSCFLNIPITNQFITLVLFNFQIEVFKAWILPWLIILKCLQFTVNRFFIIATKRCVLLFNPAKIGAIVLSIFVIQSWNRPIYQGNLVCVDFSNLDFLHKG